MYFHRNNGDKGDNGAADTYDDGDYDNAID